MWEKIPGPLPLYRTGSDGKKAGWGLETRLAHRFVALVGNFFTLLHSKKMLVVAISFVQSNYMQFCKPFHQSIYCWGLSRLFVHAVVSVYRMIQNATMVKSVQQIKRKLKKKFTEYHTSLIPRPLLDFISQPWRKIGRRPEIKSMSQTGNGGLG